MVAFFINTLDESFKNDMDKAPSIHDRIEAMNILHENNIHTVVFMSPIFPYITDFKAIIEATKLYADEYWFENLNLRGGYKTDILNYIKEKYPKYYSKYVKIYDYKDKTYWIELSKEIDDYCTKMKLCYHNYFYHELVRKQ